MTAVQTHLRRPMALRRPPIVSRSARGRRPASHAVLLLSPAQQSQPFLTTALHIFPPQHTHMQRPTERLAATPLTANPQLRTPNLPSADTSR